MNETLNQIYSRYGIGNFSKSVDALDLLGNTLLDIFSQDKSTQDKFLQAMEELIKRYQRVGA